MSDNLILSSGKKANAANDPYISPSKNLPEITVKAFVLSIILTVIMSAANAYLGLKVGITVAATIPAAVISMAILKLFRHSNILENNIVQTTVSAGEGLAAAAVFTLPALIMMKFWTHFPFWHVTILLGLGGIMGVLFSIPLRRVFLVDGNLKFPEGIAAAEVLKAGDGSSKGGLKDLMVGSLLASALKFGQSGLAVFGESLNCWYRVGGSVFGFGTGLSGILVGAGYIVGIQVGVSIILGSAVAWGICVPIYASIGHFALDMDPYAVVMQIWKEKLRIIGVGCMVTGGLWTTFTLMGSMKSAMLSSWAVIKKAKLNKKLGILALRTEQDIPINYVGMGLLVTLGCLGVLLYHLLGDTGLAQFKNLYWLAIGLMVLVCTMLGFLAAVISAYIAGIIGSSNSPLSGIAIMAILSISLVLSALVSSVMGSGVEMLAMASVTVLLGSLIAGTAVISLDNLQDLKAGQLVGATPWKQQIMLLVGLLVSACFMAPVLNVLLEAYGIGDVFPREGMDPAQALSAPKAALMAGLAQSVFDLSLDWTLMSIGAGIGVIFILIDEILKRTSTWRIPVLAVAVGIYMPLEITVPVLLGGIISHFAEKRFKKSKKTKEKDLVGSEHVSQRGLLMASGIVAGEALVGILIAVLIVFFPSVKEAISGLTIPENIKILGGLCLFGLLCFYLFKVSSSPQTEK